MTVTSGGSNMQRNAYLFGLIIALAIPACDGDGGGTGGTGGTDQGGAGGINAGGGGGASGVDCSATAMPLFPAFDKSCAAAADCVVKFHQVNCCGTFVAIGINHNESAAFDAAEATCQSQYPGCGCASQPTMADDGQTSADPAAFQVDCQMGMCWTYVQ